MEKFERYKYGYTSTSIFARRRLPPTAEQRRVQTRTRTRAWRDTNKLIGKPETAVVAKALLIALATSKFHEWDTSSIGVVERMFEILEMAGYKREYVQLVIRRVRAQHKAA